MKNTVFVLWLGLAVADIGWAQNEPYKNPDLSPRERAEDLLKRLTLKEKASLMINSSPAVERLGIKPYNWWSEALHGVARSGVATVYPITYRAQNEAYKVGTVKNGERLCLSKSYA